MTFVGILLVTTRIFRGLTIDPSLSIPSSISLSNSLSLPLSLAPTFSPNKSASLGPPSGNNSMDSSTSSRKPTLPLSFEIFALLGSNTADLVSIIATFG